MKTNQNLIRKMGDFDVIQRTKDGMFNATSLMKQWNEEKGMKKEIKHFLEENKNTQEFIKALISEEKLNGRNSAYLKTRGKNGGTWMHPFLFIKFSMWLNPAFEVKVIKFVYDELIKYRNEAGDAYREMAASIQKIVPKKDLPVKISHAAKAINHIIYNQHQKEIRNLQADEPKTKELAQLERNVAMLINRGFIKDFNHLLDYLRRIWREKYTPKELRA
jgi:hypothetical protein